MISTEVMENSVTVAVLQHLVVDPFLDEAFTKKKYENLIFELFLQRMRSKNFKIKHNVV